MGREAPKPSIMSAEITEHLDGRRAACRHGDLLPSNVPHRALEEERRVGSCGGPAGGAWKWGRADGTKRRSSLGRRSRRAGSHGVQANAAVRALSRLLR